jgi:hypothetical protein
MDFHYLQEEINKFHKGEITLEDLKNKLHYLIDDVIIPDAVYMLNRPGEM